MKIKVLIAAAAGMTFCLAGPFQTAHADGSPCVLMKYERQDSPEGGHTVYNAVPVFPNLVPPKPVPTFPLNPLVVEGNDGQFVQLGSNVTHLEFARFHWRAGSYGNPQAPVIRFPFGAVFQIGSTSHYEICVFQDGKEDRCEADIAASGDNNGRGFLKMYADCSAEIHLVNGMRGLSPGSGVWPKFQPQYDPSVAPQILEIFWKMRACNFSKCSDWTDKVTLYWVPPPKLRAPTFSITTNSTRVDPNNPRTDFPVTFAWEPAAGIRTGPSYESPTARLCIASPGQRCPSSGSTSPNAAADPWVLWVDVPNNAVGGVAITGAATYLDSNSHIFGFAGRTVNWSAANCWKLPAGNVVCVYNNQVGTVTFLP